jgi:hypothetical protein
MLSTFFPPTIQEKCLASYVLDRFQSPSEDLNQYLTSVMAAADIPGYRSQESLLMHQVLQNLHPNFRLYLMFSNKPVSIQELFSPAITVAKAVAVEN